MVIFYSRWGLLVLPFAILSFIVSDWAERSFGFDEVPADALGTGIFAALCIASGLYLNRPGSRFGRSRVFFINIEYMGYAFAVLTAGTFVGYMHPGDSKAASVQAPTATSSQAASRAVQSAGLEGAVGSLSTPAAQPSPASPPAAQPVTLLPVDWRMHNLHDAMTGSDTKQIVGELTFGDGTYVDVAAYFDDALLVARFATFGPKDPKPFKSADNTTGLRVRMGDGEVRTAVATKDYQNRAQIVFADYGILDGTNNKKRNGANGVELLLGWAEATNAIENAAKSASDLRELTRVTRVLVELPLADGSTNVVDLNPTHPVFRAFVSGSGKVAALPLPSVKSDSFAPRSVAGGMPRWCSNGRVRSPMEEAICTDDNLGAADIRFESLYNRAVNLEDREARSRAMNMIRAFRKDRKTCEAGDGSALRRCLVIAYDAATRLLNNELGQAAR